MQKSMTWWPQAAVAILGACWCAGAAQATPASGFAGTTLSTGRFEAFAVRNHLPLQVDDDQTPEEALWRSIQRTKGLSDLYVQSNVWAPGGSTGWHTHPGHSLIIVTQGTITAYEGDDPSCTPRAYTVGMTLVDPGGDHVHLLRNDGPVEARTVAVQLIPAGAARRIDAAAPAACPIP